MTLATVDRVAFDAWLAGYFAAWASNDPLEVERLFAPDAVYHYGPFGEPARGRPQIVANWIADGVPAEVEFRYDVLAVDDDVGVANWWVRQRQRPGDDELEMDGILVIRFDAGGKCVEHREWFHRR